MTGEFIMVIYYRVFLDVGKTANTHQSYDRNMTVIHFIEGFVVLT